MREGWRKGGGHIHREWRVEKGEGWVEELGWEGIRVMIC